MAIIVPAGEAIQAAIRQGRNATASLSEWRSRGGQIRTQTWYRVWGQIENEQLQAIPEAAQRPTLRPTAEQIQERRSKRPGAYHQDVTLIVQDSHGNVELRNVHLRTDKLLSRRGAVKEAQGKWNQVGPEARQGSSGTTWRAIGGVYLGTFELTPWDE